MTAPTNTLHVETIREQFELAYATAWASDSQRTETAAQLAEMVKNCRGGDTYPLNMPRLRFGWEAYQWAASKGAPALTDQDAELLEQGASLLEALSRDARDRGNDSEAMGAECSAHAVRRLWVALKGGRA